MGLQMGGGGHFCSVTETKIPGWFPGGSRMLPLISWWVLDASCYFLLHNSASQLTGL